MSGKPSCLWRQNCLFLQFPSWPQGTSSSCIYMKERVTLPSAELKVSLEVTAHHLKLFIHRRASGLRPYRRPRSDPEVSVLLKRPHTQPLPSPVPQQDQCPDSFYPHGKLLQGPHHSRMCCCSPGVPCAPHSTWYLLLSGETPLALLKCQRLREASPDNFIWKNSHHHSFP